jgi:hypothetical protein
MYKVPPYTASSKEDYKIMMHARYEVHVWPHSHPRGGGGYIHSSNMEDHAHYKHPSMLVHNMNTDDIRQEDSHDDHHRPP